MYQPQQQHESRGGVFPTTHWTIVNALKHGTPEQRESLLLQFVEQYTPAFRIHLIRSRGLRQEADIEDVIQGFLADKFIVRNILEHVHANHGRLRDYLRRCLDHYVFAQHRSKASVAWDKRVAWDDLHHDPRGFASAPGICPFDVGWARTVMTEAIIRTKDQFFHGQRQHVWDVFDLCIVRPLLFGRPATPYAELSEQLGLTVKAIQNRRVSAMRAFSKHLSAVIAAYAGNDPEQIAAEIADLNTIMRSEGFQETLCEVQY